MPTHYAVSARTDGWRRAGRVWMNTPTIVEAGDLDDAQMEMLRADPAVSVLDFNPDTDGLEPEPEAVARALTVAEARVELLHAAMRELEPGNEDHFTAGGAPEIAALKRISGLASISAADRDAAWAAHQQ